MFPFGDIADLNRVKMWRLCVFPFGDTADKTPQIFARIA